MKCDGDFTDFFLNLSRGSGERERDEFIAYGLLTVFLFVQPRNQNYRDGLVPRHITPSAHHSDYSKTKGGKVCAPQPQPYIFYMS